MQRLNPPACADEITMLKSWLDFHRATLLGKCAGLSDEQLRQPLSPSTITLGGLLHHLCFVEDYWLHYVMLGESPGSPWDQADWEADPDWDWHAAASLSGDHLRTLFVETTQRSDADLQRLMDGPDGLDRLAVIKRRDEQVSLRWVLVHLVEEYARHNGHADFVREAIDGATGD